MKRLDELPTYDQLLQYLKIDDIQEDDMLIASESENFDKLTKIWSMYKFKYENPTFPKGNIDAKILVLGQNPGKRYKKYYPFIWSNNANDKFFMKACNDAGIKEYCWFTNLVGYPTEDNKLKMWQIEECKDIFLEEVNTIGPNVIIGLGSYVLEYFQYLKNKYSYKQLDIPYINVWHPTFVNRWKQHKSDDYDEYVQQLRSAKRYLGGK